MKQIKLLAFQFWLKVFMMRKEEFMLTELIRAFLLIFAAEMGDKTQIIAMTFATQYKVKEVILGVTLGVLANHGIAILLGSAISRIIPMNTIQILAGFLFILFGINALKDDEDDEEAGNKKTLGPVATVAMAFFVGELGDKTQLTAMTLSAEGSYPLFILFGTTLGMIATSSLGIFVGSKIGGKIPEVTIKIASSLVFVFFGTLKLYTTLPVEFLSTMNITIFLLLLTTIEIYLISNLRKRKKSAGDKTPLKEAAQKLYVQTQKLKETLDSICLGTGKCGTCSGAECLLGYIRFILKDARENEDYYHSLGVDTSKLVKKDYDRIKVMEALVLIISDAKKYGWEYNEDFVLVKIKEGLELFLFGKSIGSIKNIDEYIENISFLDKKMSAAMKIRLGNI